MNPCEKCIVKTMCKESCFKFEGYVKATAHKYGYDLRSPEKLASWLKHRPNPKGLTCGWYGFVKSSKAQVTLDVYHNVLGTISNIYWS